METSLKDKTDTLETIYEYTNPYNEQPLAVTYSHTGKHLMCIEYASDAPEISQLVISAKINDNINTSVTVSGTNGKNKKAYIDFTSNSNTGNIELSFQPLVKISKITVMG